MNGRAIPQPDMRAVPDPDVERDTESEAIAETSRCAPVRLIRRYGVDPAAGAAVLAALIAEPGWRDPREETR